MPSVFNALSSAATANDLVALLANTSVDHRIASHAIFCLGKLLTSNQPNQHSQASDDSVIASLRTEDISKFLLAPLERGAVKLDCREVSKAAGGLAKVHVAVRAATNNAAPVVGALHALAREAASEQRTAGQLLDAQAVANLLHALGTVSHPPSPNVLRSLQRRVATLAMSATVAPQDLANSLWSLSKMGVPAEPALISACGSVLPAASHRLKPMELSMTAWALATLPLLSADDQRALVAPLHDALTNANGLMRGLNAQVRRTPCGHLRARNRRHLPRS